MSRRVNTSKRRVGRPTAGARAGEKVKDYPQLSVRVPPDIKTRVSALSKLRRTSQWHIITDAIECYFRDLPAAEQATVEAFVQRRSKQTKDR
jgi:predicted transcriptional regulator